jgi:hypothetical protein
MTPGTRAAVEVARQVGLDCTDPLLIQETNNTVVWLRPHPVIAKVAVRTRSFTDLLREHEVATVLVAHNAPIASPLAGVGPLWDDHSGFPVTLWNRLVADGQHSVSGEMVGRSLRQLHEAFDQTGVVLPSLMDELMETRKLLMGDHPIPALGRADRRLLCSVMTDLMGELALRSFDERGLHGEPHDGNYLVTSSGLRWFDLEDACIGPLEWDLAFLPDNGVAAFDDVDSDLLDLLRTLNSARRRHDSAQDESSDPEIEEVRPHSFKIAAGDCDESLDWLWLWPDTVEFVRVDQSVRDPPALQLAANLPCGDRLASARCAANHEHLCRCSVIGHPVDATASNSMSATAGYPWS